MKVYVYQEYCDGFAFGEQLLKIFKEKEHAKQYLRARVENYFETEWSRIKRECAFDRDCDTLKSDYVAVGDGDGNTLYWIIEPHNVSEKPIPVKKTYTP